MGVTLSQIAQTVPYVRSVVGSDVMVTEITHDSRDVVPGTVFVAIRGAVYDGHDFLQAAVDAGAAALVVEAEQPFDIPQLIVSDSRRAMPWIAREVFSHPDDSMTIVGVTGTNGKTTVTHMLESILDASEVRSGIVGTLGARIASEAIPTVRTTPEATDLQRILATMRDNDIATVLMEVSSHAIELHRSDAIHFSVVGFTNLSQDHLDFHGTMDAYFDTKKQIFDPAIADVAVINVGDPWGKKLAAETAVENVTVSAEPDANTDLMVADAAMTARGTTFTMHSRGATIEVSLPMVGMFNVSNAAVAIGIALEIGIDRTSIQSGLRQMPPIAGRMELIAHHGPFTVLVDYAHTPDAISVVLDSVQDLTDGRVIAVIGAGGDRDMEKRPIMGASAARRSDLTVITTDNPRSEDPVLIAEEVARGAMAQPMANVEVIVDRRAAIRRAVSVAESGDIIVVLGKGHEQGQDIGSEVLPFDDRDEARLALEALGWESE